MVSNISAPQKGCSGAIVEIYGRLDCPSALRAIAKGDTYRKHRVFFADAATAVAAGYRPCGTCLRAEYKLWRAFGSETAMTTFRHLEA